MKKTKKGKPKPAFSLLSSLKVECNLRGNIANGMQAVAPTHRTFIRAEDRQLIADSIDFDESVREECPHDNRWDYFFSVPTTKVLIALEPHTSSDGEIKVIVAKRNHARAYLQPHLQPGRRIAHWLWVTEGRVGFSSMDKMRRLLNQNGISFEGRSLKALSTYS